jgi:hypothetical protein
MKRRWYRFGIEFATDAFKIHFWRWTWTFGK